LDSPISTVFLKLDTNEENLLISPVHIRFCKKKKKRKKGKKKTEAKV
jgi:hypothetical protein